jgi:hypothetical protein
MYGIAMLGTIRPSSLTGMHHGDMSSLHKPIEHACLFFALYLGSELPPDAVTQRSPEYSLICDMIDMSTVLEYWACDARAR